jgi:SIR2-like domain
MYDERLIRKINQGRAFALVGSGPSTEMGYPSWGKLLNDVATALKNARRMSDEPSYTKFIAEKRYAELLSQAERDLGSRTALVALLDTLLKPSSKDGAIYNLLTNWPFGCYLTTNWDDEINKHLRHRKTFFSTLQNTREDLAQIRHDASRLIVKLHSDLKHPTNAVITSADYAKLTAGDGKYFRDRLKAIFEMFDVVVVGHSLSDPDIRLILQLAKETASPQHPVFFIAADLTKAEVREYLEQFNVVALTYDNRDGNHIQLRRLLSFLDKFIIPRQKRIDLSTIPYSPEELEAAQAVALYRRLATVEESMMSSVLYLGPLILRSLFQQDAPLRVEEIIRLGPLSSVANTDAIRNQVPAALEALAKDGLVDHGDCAYKLSEKGSAGVSEILERRKTEEEQAYGQFSVELQSLAHDIRPKEQHRMTELLHETLVKVFKQRGLSIANAIFAGQSLGQDALSDVFSAISSSAASISPSDVAVVFMEAAEAFLLRPTDPQRRYLASVSQGFFLYHLFGLDPTCAKIRREVFEHTIWWCDASTLLPLLASGTENHPYAADLFARLQNLKAFTLTTGRLVREVLEHLVWAIRLLERESLQSPVVLEAATQKGGYKQNLFLDGYIRLSAEGKVSKFSEYVQMVAPYGATDAGIRKVLATKAVRVINADQLDGFGDNDTREMFELVHEISEVRERSATLRSNLQVEAEAEILQIIRKLKDGKYKPPVENMQLERTYFLSQSRILDRIPPADPVSWTPEVLYRYIIALPGEKLSPDLLHKCLLQEYLGAGVTIIDKERYERFFGPSINAANTTYREERDQYLKEISTASAPDLDTAYREIPDLEKPFFVQQMGWRLAENEKKRADEAQRQVKFAATEAATAKQELAQLKIQRDAKWKHRAEIRAKQLAAENRNARDPKHQRKRERQAKRRRKRK